MGWKTVELQIENLIPGILLCSEIAFLKSGGFQVAAADDPFINGVVFIAISYVLGLVSALLCRGILDWLSERGPRALVFSVFAHTSRSDLVEEFKSSDAKFENELKMESKHFFLKWLPVSVSEWNVSYRSALRQTKRVVEVDRRRSQCRLVRNLCALLVLGTYIITQQMSWPSFGVWLINFKHFYCLLNALFLR